MDKVEEKENWRSSLMNWSGASQRLARPVRPSQPTNNEDSKSVSQELITLNQQHPRLLLKVIVLMIFIVYRNISSK